MTSLFDDLKLTVLGVFQQRCFSFPIRLVVFHVDNERWTLKAPQHGRKVVRCQFAINSWHYLPRESCFDLRLNYSFWKHVSKSFFLHAAESIFRKESSGNGTIEPGEDANR